MDSGTRTERGGCSRWQVFRARLYFAATMKTRVRDVPWEVVLIGRKRPPERVFAAFRRLHGIEGDQ